MLTPRESCPGLPPRQTHGAAAKATALATAFVFVLASAFAQTPQDVAQVGFDSSVTILTYNEHGQAHGIGSGFSVGAGQVLTNAHVIAGAASIKVRPIGTGSASEVTHLLLVDEELDLALLAVDSDLGPPLPVLDGVAPAIGEAVFAVGSPLGLEGTFSQGIVSGYRTVNWLELMQITAPISPGSSGGPVLDIRGNVVGVAVAAFAEGQNLNFAIPVTAIKQFLQREQTPVAVASARDLDSSPLQAAEGEALTDGIQGGALRFEAYRGGRYSFSLRNQLPRPVHNVELVVAFYDDQAFPIDVDLVRVRQVIPPGLAQRVTSRVDRSVHELVAGRIGGTEPRTKVEVRVLSFEFAD